MLDGLAVALSEGHPPVYLAEPFLLRQWYAKYHPDSGPLRISNADELESLLGEDVRTFYGDLKAQALHAALQQRVKPVLLGILYLDRAPWRHGVRIECCVYRSQQGEREHVYADRARRYSAWCHFPMDVLS